MTLTVDQIPVLINAATANTNAKKALNEIRTILRERAQLLSPAFQESVRVLIRSEQELVDKELLAVSRGEF